MEEVTRLHLPKTPQPRSGLFPPCQVNALPAPPHGEGSQHAPRHEWRSRSAYGQPPFRSESAAVRSGQAQDTHCGEMSKRTSLSSHSTSSTPLMAASRRALHPPPSPRAAVATGVEPHAPAALGIGCGGARAGAARSPALAGPAPRPAEVAAAAAAGCAAMALWPARLRSLGSTRGLAFVSVLCRRAECSESLVHVVIAAFPRVSVLSGTR